MKKPFLAAAYVLMVVTLITVWSCRKKDQTCTAVITVTDAAGAPQAGATVHLYPNTTSTLTISAEADTIQTTDGSGKSTFKFKLQAILNASVTIGGLSGSGIVKLEPAETVEKTIIVQ